MKKFIVFFFLGILAAVKAEASFPDLTVLSTYAVQLCPQCTQDHLQMFQSAVEFVKKAKDRDGRKEMLGETQAHLKSYGMTKGKDILNKYANKLNSKLDDKPISYTRMIKKTTTDVENVEDVSETFKKYFLYVPSTDEEVQASYRGKREQFIEDTTVELYITAKEMDAELKVMLSQLELIKQCLVMGNHEKCQAEGLEDYNCQSGDDQEDEMCYRRNLLLVADIYDTIVKNNEYLMAMKAQYEAIRTLGEGAKPKEVSEKSNKTSSLQQYSFVSTAFAAQEIENELLILDELPESKYDFKSGNKTGVDTPLKGRENDIVAPAIFSEAQKHISNAIESHNLKQKLPDFKEIFISYHNMQNLHKKYVKELQESQKCVLNYLSHNYDDSEKVWLDNCRVADDGYVCAYNPAKAFSDTTSSEGIYDISCPNDFSHKCYKLAPTAYNEIGGMSGWLINMYLNAKDKLSASDVKAEDYIIVSSDTKPAKTQPVGVGNDARMAEKLKKQVEDGVVLADKYKEDMRTLGLLSFSIGASANEEINKDTNGTNGGSKFKVNTKPFPLWNDQKNFYNQYVDGKYENIIKYFQNAPLYKNILNLGLEMNETYEYKDQQGEGGVISKTAEAIRKEAAETIKLLLGLEDVDADSRAQQAKTILAEEKSKLEDIDNLHKQKLQELENQRVKLYRQLQDLGVEEADLNAKVEEQNSVISYAENYNEPAETAAEMDKDFQTKGNSYKTNEETLNENIEDQSQKELAAEEARSQAKNELSAVLNNKEEVLNEIKAVELKIKKARADYVLAYYNAEQKYKKDIEAEISPNPVLNEAQKAIVSAIGNFTVLDEAKEIIGYMRQYAIIKATQAKEQIDGLKNNNKDSLYYAENNAKVVQIHNEMLKKITEPEIDDIVAELGLETNFASTLAKYAGALTSVFSDICDEVNCYQPDENYFVGLVEQKRDFAAPKAAVTFSSAPMREIFNFSAQDLSFIDYYAAQKFVVDSHNMVADINKDGPVDIADENAEVLLTENSLPDSGIKLPEIWKIVLSYRPFVEKDLNLKEFLNHGNTESLSLARSGMYPCLVGSKIVDVIPAGGGKVKYAELDTLPLGYDNLPQCRTVKLSGEEYIDTQAGSADNKIQPASAEAMPALGASELGNVLEYVELEVNTIGEDGLPRTDMFGTMISRRTIEYISFRKEILEALRFIKDYIESFEDEENIDFNAEYYLYSRIFPQNNQFGEYLNKMDLERIGLEAEEKIKNRLYSLNIDDDVVVNNLYKSFASLGYDFDREKFDLSDDDYYQQTANVLNAHKEDNLRSAKILLNDERLKSVSDAMTERKNDLLRKISLLELDAEEEVSISSAETLEELAEKIKTERADRAIVAEEKEAADKQMQEKLSQNDEPYCAVYAW